MATNQYFNSNYYSNADQTLVEDLLIESIKIMGLDIQYLPYTILNEDRIYGEDTLHLEYTKAYPMEVYFESIQGFDGQDFLSKFGTQIKEVADIMCSMKRFQQCTNYLYQRPREKDLIYLPLTDSLYEITFVEHEKIFKNIGMIANATYSIKIDLFNYSHQRIRTGVLNLDKFEDNHTFAINFNLDQGSGRYLIAETVYQGNSLAEATAKGICVYYNRVDKILKLKEIWGQFNTALPIIGSSSNVSYTILSVDERELPNDPIADNKPINDEKILKDVINFDEKNPFGDP